MKILMLNYEYPPLGGGAGAITQKISQGLANRGHQITVITSGFSGLAAQVESGLLKIYRVEANRRKKYQSNPLQMLSWAKATIRFFNKNFNKKDFDLVFANFAIPGGMVARQIKRKTGIPYVVISHGHDIPWFCKKEMWVFQTLLYFKIKRICTDSELNFIQTAEMKANIDKFIGETNAEKNVIIPNGWDFQRLESNLEKHEKFTIVFSARFVKQKDPIGLLKALEILNERGIPFKANLFGNGPLMRKMKKYIESKSLNHCIELKGWTDRDELKKEYASSHVFVLASFHEAMSVSVMDALSSGLFVICTDTGQNKNLLIHQKNGIIIQENNPSQLADALEWYYTNKFKSGNIKVSFPSEDIIESYSWDRIILSYEKALQKVICEK